MTKNQSEGFIKISIIGNEWTYQFSFYLFLVLFIFNGYEFGTIVERAFIPTILLILSTFIVQCKNIKKPFLQAAILSILAVVSTYFSNVINITQSRILTFCFCCFTFALVSCAKISRPTVKRIINFYVKFVFALIVIVLTGYLFKFGIDSFGRASINFGSFYKDQNYLSAFFMPAFAICFYGVINYQKRKIMNSIQCGFTFLAVFFMGSRGSLLTLLLIIALVVAKLVLNDQGTIKKIGFACLLTVSVFAFYLGIQSSPLFQRMFNFETYSLDIRVRLWVAGLSGFYENYLLGSGIGAASAYAWSSVGNAVHNSFIEILSDQGILGSAVLLWMILDIIIKPRGSRFFLFILMVAFFVPLFFLSGYSNFTFWAPMFFMKFII